MSPDPAPLWRRIAKGVVGVLLAFGFMILWTAGLGLLVFLGLRYFLPETAWQSSALIATLIAGVFLVSVFGEALMGIVFIGLWSGLKSLWRRYRR